MNTWAKAVAITVMIALSGCASTLGAIGALSSAATPKVEASLQIGDKQNQTKVEGATVGKSQTSTTQSKIKEVKAAKKAEVDQSQQKTDKKTEVGEVKGNVMVNQGPDKMTLVLLSLGWPLFVGFLVYIILRRVRDVRNSAGEIAGGNSGT